MLVFPPLALLPAAGHARRLGETGHSKELTPAGAGGRPACRFLLDALDAAGVTEAVVITRRAKQDLIEYLESCQFAALRARVVRIDSTPSVPHTLDAAYPRTRERRIILGFPDILLHPQQAVADLLRAHAASEAPLTLGLFPAERPHAADMVELDASGRVVGLRIKSRSGGQLDWMWALAVWEPEVTEYLHDFVCRRGEPGGAEPQVGHVVRKAIADGIEARGFVVPGGRCLDIGTPRAVRRARDWPVE